MKNKITKLISLALALTLSLAAIGCGSGNTDASNTVAENSYATAIEIMNVLWDNSSKDFPAFGGNFENNTADAPGTIPASDAETMTNMLLIPKDVQDHVTDAATLFHMMNSNTFTGAALKLDGITADEAAGKIKEAFKGTQFMCGIPDKIVIYTVGNDLVFFFGATDIIDTFKTAAEKLDSAKLVVDENY